MVFNVFFYVGFFGVKCSGYRWNERSFYENMFLMKLVENVM